MAREDLTERQQADYDECIANGCAPKLAEMLAVQQPPGANTDREFWAGRWNQFVGTEDLGDDYRRRAEAAGQNTVGKFYVSGLAKYPGDPEAWVSNKGEMENKIDKEGWGADGCVQRPIKKIVEAAQIGVAPDLIAREVNEIVASLPAADQPHVDTEDLAAQVYEKRKGWWVK